MYANKISTNWRIAPTPIPDDHIAGDYSADVIVVGLGNAGTAASRAAAEAGASVIGLEKMKQTKYRTLGVEIGHANSNFLAKRGVPKVDPIELFNEWMRRSGNRANPELVMQYCQKCGDAFDWYTIPFKNDQIESLVIEYWPPGNKFSGEISGQKFWVGSVRFYDQRVSNPDDKENFSLTEASLINQDKARKYGAEFHFDMDAQQLVMNDKKVVGVIAKDGKGQYIRYKAKKGVILAAGDFAANKEMCHDLLPDISDLFDNEDFLSLNKGDGRGIQMGVWAGGRLEARPIATMDGNHNALCGVIESFGALWVDENGKRYCNEAFGDPVFAGFPGAQLKRGKNTIVFDSKILEDLQYGPPAHTSFFINNNLARNRLEDNMAAARAAGRKGYQFSGRRANLYAAGSLGELTDYIGFEGTVKQNFLTTVKRYNEFCKTGRDEDFGKDAQLLLPIDTAPYYAEPQPNSRVGDIMVTLGGLLTDEYQNVLNQKREPISGLYATGNCCGRRFGLQYSTPICGVSIGIAITLGREVGKTVAKL